MASKTQGAPKRRTFTVINGVAPPLWFSAYNNDFNALERAVKERVFYVKTENGFAAPPRPLTPAIFAGRLQTFRSKLVKHLPSTAPITAQQFVDTYSGRKKVIYQQAMDSLDADPLRPKDAYVKTFVKYEKTNFTSKVPVPRVISPRSPRFNVEIGRFIRPIEERIFKSIGKTMGANTVMKGMNATQMASAIRSKWNRFSDPVAVGCDASRFDQHVSIDALMWEHSIYLECFPAGRHRRRLSKLLSQQLRNICSGKVGDGFVKFKTEGVRMSGDMNTSLGNVVLMCSMMGAYADSVGVDMELVNNGDDCVMIMERGSYPAFNSRLTTWFKDMGFTMIVEEPVDVFERILFCQTQPVWVGPDRDDYVMVRDPRIAIAKDSFSVHVLRNRKEVRGWLQAVGTGGEALAGGLPVWQEFYRMYQRSACGAVATREREAFGWGVRQLSKGNRRVFGNISQKTRASFCWAFGISPEEQMCIERHYQLCAVELEPNDNVARHVTLPF